MDNLKTLLLNKEQVAQRTDRIAWQIYEDNAEEKEIIIAGIQKTGYRFAELITLALKKIAPFKVTLIDLKVDKHKQVAGNIELPVPAKDLHDKVIIIVDDVLNSGKTIMYALKPFLSADIKKIRTAVLIDRNHRRFPVAVDYAGLSLATTFQEHVSAEFNEEDVMVYLS